MKYLLPPLWAIVVGYTDPLEAPMVAYLTSLPYTVNETFVTEVVDAGRRPVLEWLWHTRREPGRPHWDWCRITERLAARGHTVLFQWARRQGIRWNRGRCRLAAAVFNKLSTFKILKALPNKRELSRPIAVGDSYSPRLWSLAVTICQHEFGIPDVYKYCLENGYRDMFIAFSNTLRLRDHYFGAANY